MPTVKHEMQAEDREMFDMLYRYYQEVKQINITHQYLVSVLRSRLDSVKKNVAGLEATLNNKYEGMNFGADFRIENGVLIQDFDDPEEKPEENQEQPEEPKEEKPEVDVNDETKAVELPKAEK